MSVAIIADDLTGACDTAVQVAGDGRTVDVLLKGAEDTSASLPDIFAVSTDSRMLTGPDAYARSRDVTRKLHTKGVRQFYKKIDSLYRGNARQEVEGMLDELAIDLAVIAPAAPGNDRMIINGMLCSRNAMIEKISVLEALSDGSGRQLAMLPLSVVRQGGEALYRRMEQEWRHGAQLLLADSETETDLDVVSAACGMIRFPYLPVGTCGLAKPLLHRAFGDQDAPSLPRRACRELPILMVIGSRHPITTEQIAVYTRRRHMEALYPNISACIAGNIQEEYQALYERAERAMACAPEALLLTTDPSATADVAAASNGELSCPQVTECLSLTAAKLLERHAFAAAFMSGGDTAHAVFEAVGASRLSLEREVLPGIPVGTLTGGRCGAIRVVTKSGAFGGPEALLQLDQWIRGEHI